MDNETERQMLDEIRNLNALARHANRMSAVCLGLLVIVLVSMAVRHRWYSYLQPDTLRHGNDSWQQVRTLWDEGKLQDGKEMLTRLMQRHPQFYYGHLLMASICQEDGDLVGTERNYATAYKLFPTEDNEKNLIAIRKALANNVDTPGKLTPEQTQRP